MARILVTGGAGYIGSHTCKALAAQGHQPVVVDNFCEGHREFVKWGDFYQCDVRDTHTLHGIFEKVQPQAVIHFAASAYVGESIQNPYKYYDNNLSGAISLLQAMQAAECRQLIFSSTCAVYGTPRQLPISLTAQTEPINPYGRSKLMVEKIIHDVAATQGLDAVILRYFNAAGADLEGELGEWHEPEPHLIPNVINATLHPQQPLSIFGDDYPTADGTCVRDYVHVSDLADAHVLGLAYLDRRKGVHTFNLGTQHGASIKQVISTVEAVTGRPVSFEVLPRRVGDPAELYADASYSHAELGWQPKRSELSVIIRSAVNWAKQNAC